MAIDVKRVCTCQAWKESWPQIEGAQHMAYTHGQKYTGKVFKFCPWCREELKPKGEEDGNKR